MARITLSLQELVEMIVSNNLLPPQVVRIRVKGEKIHFVVKTNTFILPYIPASLVYTAFNGGNAIFKLTNVGGPVNKVMGWLHQVLKLKSQGPLVGIPDFMKLEYPKVFIDIDKVLKENNIRGIRVKDITLKDGQFTITTEMTGSE
jgi:hypothetical protein